MASIEQIIQREINPFDTVTFHTGNFWQEKQESNLTVESIHQKEIEQINRLLDLIIQTQQTRTILLCGERGSGKSYLLARLKKLLNDRACFAYIGPWADNDRIWRHILRYTVDSLMHVPEGQTESQLLLWLKSLTVLRDRNFVQQSLGQRGLFILNLRSIYPTGIYQAKDFFTTLYNLINPELHSLACDWLRGEDLDEEDLKVLGIKQSINTEDAAQNMLANLGRIAINTKPIFLCFDQVDKLAVYNNDRVSGLQPLFTVNSTLHNEKIENFLIIISLVTETWQENKNDLLQADLDRLDGKIMLKDINLSQAESIWQKRLFPLHIRANPQPESPIYPLESKILEQEFPGGKTNPRDTLKLGRSLIQKYKLDDHQKQQISSLKDNKVEEKTNKQQQKTKHKSDKQQQKTSKTRANKEKTKPKLTQIETPSETIAAFKLVWQKEFNNIANKISKIRHFSSPDLIKMLQESFYALETEGIKQNLLPSKSYKSYSFIYARSEQEKIGIVWTEDRNLGSFYHIMQNCKKAIERNLCKTLYLIRAEKLGSIKKKGYQLYQEIFAADNCIHIIPKLESVHYLATYHSLLNAVCSGDLVVGDIPPNITQLQAFVRDSQVLNDCSILQKLLDLTTSLEKQDPVKEFLLNIISTQQVMGLKTLITTVSSQFDRLDESIIEQIIGNLARENVVKIIDEGMDKNAHLVSIVKFFK